MINNQLITIIKKNIHHGDLLFSSNYFNNLFSITPSPIKHVAVYYGNNLLSAVQSVRNDILSNNKTYKLLSDMIIGQNVIRYINSNISNINNNDCYVLSLQWNGFKIIEIDTYLRSKSEIYLFRLKVNPNKLHIFTYLYLFFMGNIYAIVNYKQGQHYCFESIVKLLELLYGFKVQNNCKFLKYYTSQSITDNKYVFLVLILKRGILCLINN